MPGELATLVKNLDRRWFVVRGAKTNELFLLNPRWAVPRGPMAQTEIERASQRDVAGAKSLHPHRRGIGPLVRMSRPPGRGRQTVLR